MTFTRNLLLVLSVLAVHGTLTAQEVVFQRTPAEANAYFAAQVPRTIGYCVDSLRIDTVYMEHATGEMELVVQTYPLSRYEFYLDNALFRRIDIHCDTLLAVVITGAAGSEPRTVMPERILDTPNGVYHEFFPNGNIRVRGKLSGFDAQGALVKTGEWTVWNAAGEVVLKETYP